MKNEDIEVEIREGFYKPVREKIILPPVVDYSPAVKPLKAPEEYTQKTIVRGDVTLPIISLASIAAKVERDRLMKKLAKKYPQYSFEVHKGYGTEKHRKAIKRFGLSKIHRRSFCKNKKDMV